MEGSVGVGWAERARREGALGAWNAEVIATFEQRRVDRPYGLACLSVSLDRRLTASLDMVLAQLAVDTGALDPEAIGSTFEFAEFRSASAEVALELWLAAKRSSGAASGLDDQEPAQHMLGMLAQRLTPHMRGSLIDVHLSLPTELIGRLGRSLQDVLQGLDDALISGYWASQGWGDMQSVVVEAAYRAWLTVHGIAIPVAPPPGTSSSCQTTHYLSAPKRRRR